MWKENYKTMFDKKIDITVVIPTFNREKMICRCLKSVINQTYKAKEIIVIDDGSTDQTQSIVMNFPSNRIRFISQKHKGAQAARNKGIINATGNYIAFLDSDDEWLPDKLERQVEIIKRNPSAVIYSNCYVVKENSKVIWRVPGKSGWAYKELLMHPGPTFPGIIVPKDALLEIGLLDEKVPAYQEWDMSISLAEKRKLIHMEEPLFYYNMHEGETISKNKEKDILGYEYVTEKHRKDIIKLWGYLGMLEHYKLLLDKSIQYRSRRIYRYIWRWYLTALLDKLRGGII